MPLIHFSDSRSNVGSLRVGFTVLPLPEGKQAVVLFLCDGLRWKTTLFRSLADGRRNIVFMLLAGLYAP